MHQIKPFQSVISQFLEKFVKENRYLDALLIYGWDRIKITGKVRGNEMSVTSIVRSQSNRLIDYAVQLEVKTNGSVTYHCTCEDHRRRKVVCKHILATLLALEKPDKNHDYELYEVKSKVRPEDWKSTPQTQAQTQYASLDDLAYL